MKSTKHLLEVRGLVKKFGGLIAVDDLYFSIAEGEFVGLVGPNGAGKTTAFNLISGFLKPTAGKIFLENRNLVGLKPHKIARTGLTRTFQTSILFGNFTVRENLDLSLHIRKQKKKKGDSDRYIDEILEFFQLNSWQDAIAYDLPYGYQRMLGVAMAMAN